ncbi:MAG: DNA polymerase III subunit gamma/tau, partial [Thermodesulfobacteriota bacterium]
MAYEALARKWRPRTFEEIVGQGHVSRALANAIASGKIHHAYLFSGTRGVGKTTFARILARALNCEKGPTPAPCLACSACEEIGSGSGADVQEIDGASNTGIDDIRRLRENAAYAPSRLRYKIYIIDEVHMLSKAAFNGLLKTLEEPPPHVVFILATTEPNRIPDTILSRCQRFDFRMLTDSEVRGRLDEMARAEGVAVEEDALSLMARYAFGSMRDGQSIFEQAAVSGAGTVTAALVEGMLGLVGTEAAIDLAAAAVLEGAGPALA